MKKVYKTPELKKINSINIMTQAASNQGKKDGGSGYYHAS